MKNGNKNDLVVMHTELCTVMRLHETNSGVMLDVMPGHQIDIEAENYDYGLMMMIGYPGQRVNGMVLARALLKRYDNICGDIEMDLREVAEDILSTGITFTPETIRLDIEIKAVKERPGDFALTISCPDDFCLHHREDGYGDKESAVLWANNYIRFLEKYGMTVKTNWEF